MTVSVAEAHHFIDRKGRAMPKTTQNVLALFSLAILGIAALLILLASGSFGEYCGRSDALPPMLLDGTVTDIVPAGSDSDPTYIFVEVTSCNWDALPQPGETACLSYTADRLQGAAPATGDAISAMVDKDMAEATVEGERRSVVKVHTIATDAYYEEQRRAEEERREDYEKSQKAYEELDQRLKEQAQTMQSPQIF